MKQIRFKSFSSGSCGNCYFLGIEEDGRIAAGILIDAGVSLRRCKQLMLADHLGMDDWSAMLITHDHMDHIRSLGSFCKHQKKPVWATRELHEALAHNTFTLGHVGAVRKDLAPEGWSEIVPGRIRAHGFVVPHDATQTVGLALRLDDYRFVIMTDLGRMTPEGIALAREADTVVVESNYDDYMLEHGPYPPELQERIRGGAGHLSNAQCAEAITHFYHPGLRNIFLCHISENNNTPQTAHTCAAAALAPFGDSQVRLVALPRQTPSPLFIL